MTCVKAANDGQLKILKWLRANGCRGTRNVLVRGEWRPP